MKTVAVEELGGKLAVVLAAAEAGEETVVVRDGQPIAVIRPYDSVVTPNGPVARRPLPKPELPGGLLALKGYLADWETMEEDMAEVIAMRYQAVDRPPVELADEA